MAVIDLAPFVNQVVLPIVIPTATLVLTGMATTAMAWLAAKFHVQVKDADRVVVGQAIQNGLGLAEQKLGSLDMKVDASDHVAATVNYVEQVVPSKLKALGMTPDKLGAAIEAQAAKRMTTPPSTP